MEKLKMETNNLVDKNINKIAEIFPDVVTETKGENGIIKRAVNFDNLKQDLSDYVVEGDKERYELTWPGKKEAILIANQPINKTLRPVKEDSVNWDTTENLYIEGDNLEVLKLLQESYLNKIKCIYIDPPYNTGNDFIYKDDFKEDKDEYLGESGQVDGDGNRLLQNTESNGRFHSDWLTMMYPRLKLARNLLHENGVIFISIDDNEVENLKKICDEIFGEGNFIEQLVWKRRSNTPNDRFIGKIHEYILCYAKSIQNLKLYLQPRDNKINEKYKNPNNDARGPWFADNLSANGKGGRLTESCIFPIINPYNGKKYFPPQNKCWLYNKAKINRLINDGKIGFRENSGAPYLKRFLSEVRQGSTLSTLILDGGYSVDSAKEIKDLFKIDVFEFPKPTKLIKKLLICSTCENDLILDLFSGSATTAHAVMQLNAEGGGHRKYIMVQLPEPCDEKSESYKAGYKNICEIGKERIRRAANKIKDETNADIDYGFRVFRVSTSNIKDVYYAPNKIDQSLLTKFESNIKEDRNSDDLLVQVMLELDLELSLPVITKIIDGITVYSVSCNSLCACFDDNITDGVIKEIAKVKPLRAIFKDSGFKNDADKINVEEIFKMLSPSTEIKVI